MSLPAYFVPVSKYWTGNFPVDFPTMFVDFTRY
jgi:hypothetical protein